MKVFDDIQSGDSNRVNRGGSWNNNADNCAAGYRNYNNPDNRNNNLGFRLASPSIVIWHISARNPRRIPVRPSSRQKTFPRPLPVGTLERRGRTPDSTSNQNQQKGK